LLLSLLSKEILLSSFYVKIKEKYYEFTLEIDLPLFFHKKLHLKCTPLSPVKKSKKLYITLEIDVSITVIKIGKK